MTRRERHRKYAEDLLAQQRQRRSAFFPLGVTITGSLIAAVVAIVGASTEAQTIAATVGALCLGVLAMHLLRQWRNARARLVTAALRAEMLRPAEVIETAQGRDMEELVEDVQKRTGEEWEVIWEQVPNVLAEEDVAITVGDSPRVSDRTPLVTLRQHAAALFVAGLGAALVYSLASAGELPGFLRWADAVHEIWELPGFSVRGLVAVFFAMTTAQVALSFAYPNMMPGSAVLSKSHPPGSLAAKFGALATRSAKRALIARAIEPIVAGAFTVFVFATQTADGSPTTTIFIAGYVAFSLFASAWLENANLRAVSSHVREVINACGEGAPPRVSMRRLAKELGDLTGTSFDASGVAASLLRRGGVDARIWLL